MHRHSPIAELAGRIRAADAAALDKRRLLGARWGAEFQIADANRRIVELEAQVATERGDVERLRAGGIRAAVLRLLGRFDQRLEREERELFEVSLAYDAAVAQLAEAQQTRRDIEQRIEAIADAERHGEEALGELRQFIADNPGSVAQLDAAMVARLDMAAESLSAAPTGTWAEQMARLRAAGGTGRDREPVWSSLDRGKAIAALASLRGKLTTTMFGQRLGSASGLEVVTTRQERELREALDAAATAHARLTALRAGLDRPLKRDETHFERADAIAPHVIAAQTALSRFVREVADVYLLFPLSGAFATLVFEALRTADESPVTADPDKGYEYLYEWINLLELYVRDLRGKLGE